MLSRITIAFGTRALVNRLIPIRRVVQLPPLALLVLTLSAASAVERPVPETAALLEDNAEQLLPLLTNPTGCPGEGHVERDVVFSGQSSIRIVPMQRFAPAIPGWSYMVAENPKPGEYRFLRFAWKSRGCSGIMLQLHDETDWNIRYTAGIDKYGWGTKYVAERPSDEWSVVTVDLFKEFGKRTIRGMALTCFDGVGYFDHIHLGRTLDDLDRIDATSFATDPPRDWTPEKLETHWREATTGTDAAAAYQSFWALAAARPAAPFIAEKLKAVQQTVGIAAIRKWIAQLDEDDFDTRQKATESLAKVAGEISDLLQEELGKTESAERKFRLKQLLDERAAPSAKNDEIVKGIRILELSLSPDAEQILAELAAGDERDKVSRTAREALARRKKIAAKPAMP